MKLHQTKYIMGGACIIALLAGVLAVNKPHKETKSENKITVTEDDSKIQEEKDTPILYTGLVTETEHVSFAAWGETYDETKSILVDKYQPSSLRELNVDKKMLFNVGMLEKPWDTYYDFNDNDELYRVDMNTCERVIGEQEDEAYLLFLSNLLNSVYDKYGNVGGYLYSTQTTVDYATMFKDLSTIENLQMFQDNDYLSITYKKDEMNIWLVLLREDYTDELGEELGVKQKIAFPQTDKSRILEKSVREDDDKTLIAKNTDSIYTVYIGFLNSRFSPPTPKDMEITEDPMAINEGLYDESIISSDNERIDIDKEIMESELTEQP